MLFSLVQHVHIICVAGLYRRKQNDDQNENGPTESIDVN